MLLTAIIFIAILGFLVFIHELGHFWAAKRAGVRVEEFAFGFRPRLFAWQRGETTYAINVVPLGGYVRMYGENEDETGARSYRSKTIRQRFGILTAGVAMNFVFGWLILTVLFMTGFSPLYPGVGSNPFVNSTQQVIVTEVAADSPAALSGLQSGDRVVAVNGESVAVDQEFLYAVRNNLDHEIALTVHRGEADLVVNITPRAEPPEGQGPLGVAISSTGKVRSSYLSAPAAGFYEAGRIVGSSIAGFGRFIGQLVVKQQVSSEVTGLIGVGALTGATRRLGLDYLAQLIALVTIGLATVNLLPILPLDGGHVAVLAYEKIVGRKPSERFLGGLATIGIVFVLAMFVAVTYKDLIRFDVLGRIF